MQKTKVKHTETHNGILVCKGKLLILYKKYDKFSNIIEQQNEVTKKYHHKWIDLKWGWGIPFIVSTLEEIKNGDNVIVSRELKKVTKDTLEICKRMARAKAIVAPELFSFEHLSLIKDSILNQGERVFVECEERFVKRGVKMVSEKFVKTTNKHISLFLAEEK